MTNELLVPRAMDTFEKEICSFIKIDNAFFFSGLDFVASQSVHNIGRTIHKEYYTISYITGTIKIAEQLLFHCHFKQTELPKIRHDIGTIGKQVFK